MTDASEGAGLPGGSATEHQVRSDDDTVPIETQSSVGGALELREEELLLRKRLSDAGAVELRKEIVREPHVADVHVWHEELVIEHEPVVPPRPTAEPIDLDQTVRVMLREVVVTFEKEPVVAEAVRVGRRVVDETQHIETEIQREVADVHEEGDVEIREIEPPPDARPS